MQWYHRTLPLIGLMTPGVSLPRVSCICLTFGRPRFLEEAIESFLRQDYPGEAELIVLNDFAPQQLTYTVHPRVRLINCHERFASLGEKRNAAIESSIGEVILTWDDDDISLPGRIRQAVSAIQAGTSFYRPSWSWVSRDDEPPRLFFERVAWPQCGFTSELYRRVGGYPPRFSGEDREFAARLAAAGYPTAFSRGEPEEACLIYRMWSENPHASGISTGVYQYADVHELVARTAPRGTIALEPRWRKDYQLLCQTAKSGCGSHF
jgi:glycosyltransferase involved in cell wall biosynthesis